VFVNQKMGGEATLLSREKRTLGGARSHQEGYRRGGELEQGGKTYDGGRTKKTGIGKEKDAQNTCGAGKAGRGARVDGSERQGKSKNLLLQHGGNRQVAEKRQGERGSKLPWNTCTEVLIKTGKKKIMPKARKKDAVKSNLGKKVPRGGDYEKLP